MIYYILILIAVTVSSVSRPGSLLNSKYVSNTLVFFLFLLGSMTIYVTYPAIDMTRYINAWNSFRQISFIQAVSFNSWEPGFVLFQWVTSKIFISDVLFRIAVALFFWWLIYISLSKFFSKRQMAYVFFLYFNLFYFWSMSANIVRQGLATGFVFLSISFLLRNNTKKALLFTLLASLFHSSGLIGLIPILVSKLNFSVSKMTKVWLIGAALFISNLNRFLITRIPFLGSSGYVTSYGSDAVIQRYGAVNRLDFLIFSGAWIIWGHFARRYFSKNNALYDKLLVFYMGLNLVFLLFGFVGYSDRIAGYSWLTIPVIIAYPVLNCKNKYRQLAVLAGLALIVFFAVWFNVFERFSELHLFY